MEKMRGVLKETGRRACFRERFISGYLGCYKVDSCDKNMELDISIIGPL